MKISFRRIAALSLLALAATFPLSSSANNSKTGKWVTGYFAGWFWDDTDYQAPQYVDMTAMTHFVFARIGPGAGQLGGTAGEVKQGGGTSQTSTSVGPGAPTRTVEQYMIDKAHENGAKAIVMLGGENENSGFKASTTDAVRPLFVKNLLDYLEAHNYDGIDVNWEGIPSSDLQQQDQLVALVADLRSESAKRERYRDTPLIITHPAGVLNTNIDSVLPYLVELGAMVDQFNIMSYGMGWFGSGWTSTTFAPLTGKTASRPVDISSTIQKYVDAGIPREKIGMGLGFYGMNYIPPFTGPNQSTEGYDRNTSWSVYDVLWNYAQLKKHGYLDHGTYVWEASTQTAYRTYAGGYAPATRSTTTTGYLSYEDEASIMAKGAWAQSTEPGKGAGGTIIWLVNYGTTDGVNNPLLFATKKAFLDPNATESPPPPPAEMTMELVITNDWNSGYCGNFVVENIGGVPVEWSVTKTFKDTVTSLWNGAYTQTGDQLTVSGASWNKTAYPGQPIEVGMCANRAPAEPEEPSDPEPGALSASYVISNDWGSGYCANVTVTNSGSTVANNWSVEMPVQGTIASLWNGKYTQGGSSLTLSGPDWYKNLAANSQYKDIGFCANR